MKRNEKANFNLKKETGFTGIFDYYISFDCFSWHGPIVGLSDAWNNFRSISVVLAYDKNCHVQVGQLAIHVYPFFNWLFFSSMASLLLGRRVNSTAKSFSFLIVRPQTFTFTRATSRWTVIGHKFTWSLPSLICSIFFTGKWSTSFAMICLSSLSCHCLLHFCFDWWKGKGWMSIITSSTAESWLITIK